MAVAAVTRSWFGGTLHPEFFYESNRGLPSLRQHLYASIDPWLACVRERLLGFSVVAPCSRKRQCRYLEIRFLSTPSSARRE